MAAAALTRQMNTMVTTVRGLQCLERATSFDSYAKQIRMWTQTYGLHIEIMQPIKLSSHNVETTFLRVMVM